jgi:hypothetical protein
MSMLSQNPLNLAKAERKLIEKLTGALVDVEHADDLLGSTLHVRLRPVDTCLSLPCEVVDRVRIPGLRSVVKGTPSNDRCSGNGERIMPVRVLGDAHHIAAAFPELGGDIGKHPPPYRVAIARLWGTLQVGTPFHQGHPKFPPRRRMNSFCRDLGGHNDAGDASSDHHHVVRVSRLENHSYLLMSGEDTESR